MCYMTMLTLLQHTPITAKRYRGALVTLADISINLGILIGYCVDFWVRTQFSDDRDLSWRLAMAIGAVFPFVYVANTLPASILSCPLPLERAASLLLFVCTPLFVAHCNISSESY